MMENKKAPLSEILLKHVRSINDNEHHNMCFTKRNPDTVDTADICDWFIDPHWGMRNIPIPALECLYGTYKYKTRGKNHVECMRSRVFEIVDFKTLESVPAYVVFRFTYGPKEYHKKEMEFLKYLTDKVFHMPLYLGKEGRKMSGNNTGNTLIFVFPSTLTI